MDLEQKLKEAEALVASVRKEIEESKELKPFSWSNEARYDISKTGSVFRCHGVADNLFYKKTREQAESFAHRLKILSCINNLKETLGCDWEFTKGAKNYHVSYDSLSAEWYVDKLATLDDVIIYFKSVDDCQKVAKYLNKHYPNGWRLA